MLHVNSIEISSCIYLIIEENLDELLSNSDSLDDLKNNIKLLTYKYLLENDYIYFVEGFDDILDAVKVTFWSTTVRLWSGKFAIGNWAGGVLSNYIATGRFNPAMTVIAKLVRQYTTSQHLMGSELVVVNVQLMRVAALLLFPTVLLGLVIYRVINYNDILTIKNFEFSLKSFISHLSISNKTDLSINYSKLNIKYQEALQSCLTITDDKQKLISASNYYIKYITEGVMVNVINEYIIYLKKINVDCSYIINFKDLFNLTININPLTFKRTHFVYELYMKVLDKFLHEPILYKRYLDLLDTTTINKIKEVYNK